MPKHYLLHAMGVKKGLQFRKPHLKYFMDSALGVAPVRHVVVSGMGSVQRRLSDDERPVEGGKLAKKRLTPLSFKF